MWAIPGRDVSEVVREECVGRLRGQFPNLGDLDLVRQADRVGEKDGRPRPEVPLPMLHLPRHQRWFLILSHAVGGFGAVVVDVEVLELLPAHEFL